MEIKAILLNGRVYDKKDNKGKGLALNVLVNYDNLDSAKVVNLFAGSAYVGTYDLSEYKTLEEINVEYDQPMGSQYPKLINISKIVKK